MIDSFDSALLWSILGLLPFALIAWYVLRRRYNELIALHLIVFWAQFFPYGSVWMFGQPQFLFPGWAMALLAFELTVYCGTFLILAPFLTRYTNTVSNAALDISSWTLFLWVIPSIVLSAFIVSIYGVVALIPYANIAESAGLPAWLNYVNIALLAPAWGAVYCCSVRFAYRRYHPVQMLGLLFLVGRMFLETGEGKRYFLMICLVAILFGSKRPFRINGRTLVQGVLAGILMFVVWSWYEGVRSNYSGILISGTAYDSAFDEAADVLLPGANESGVDRLINQKLQTRQPPIWFLSEIVQLPELGHGAYVVHAFENVIPSSLSDKQYENENDVLANTTNFPWDDYPWTMMTEFQAEMSEETALFTPILYVFLFWLSCVVISRWRGRSDLVVLVGIGVVIFEAGEVQTHLTVILVQLRSLGLYVLVGFILWQLRQIGNALKVFLFANDAKRARMVSSELTN